MILEKQMFPIFNKDKSILLARPQTPKTKRVSHRQKKNAAALQIWMNLNLNDWILTYILSLICDSEYFSPILEIYANVSFLYAKVSFVCATEYHSLN